MHRDFIVGWLKAAAACRRIECGACGLEHDCATKGCRMLRAAAREIERLAEDNRRMLDAYARMSEKLNEQKKVADKLRTGRSDIDGRDGRTQ